MSLEQVNPIDLAILRLETVSERAAQFMDSIMMDVAIREILDPMKSLANSRGISQRFIDAMEIRKTGFMQVAFVINYIPGPNGIALNKLLEFGWGQGGYTITFNPVGVWTGGIYGPGFHFAHSVEHPGFQGYNMLISLQNWGFIESFVIKLVSETTKYLEAVSFK